MGLKRPHLVDQKENATGQFWYTVRGGNGANLLTSEMYPTRSNAIRAARRYIASIDPVPVRFTYWTGLTPVTLAGWHAPSPTARRQVTERIR
ncbi:Uncharacterised protein [Mycolicibacterium vanbaalenii]|uniref:DUF1508 domain-containing protein n=1 Tax=Mycolicibacterium vanbaalenii TaxID=110539 RepID=A0A5S9R668_MYCVN|nr:Uncharacterised protein [Mycolicibacterium vanbaalenii]